MLIQNLIKFKLRQNKTKQNNKKQTKKQKKNKKQKQLCAFVVKQERSTDSVDSKQKEKKKE